APRRFTEPHISVSQLLPLRYESHAYDTLIPRTASSTSQGTGLPVPATAARIGIEVRTYNTEQPHSSGGYLTPERFARARDVK
ncbi:integrase core domain-containing protein, partial [Burkholderia cenocepacia]|uniref:hypothetical protein n=1 Tax=Burkholderia cenocepacia TaxID=95486 RepID=UPI002230DDC0